MTTKRLASRIMAILTLTLAPVTVAQDFTIDWHTIDGGGIMFSTGGNFELGSTIGQPDAGSMTGGNFELSGGFWPVANVCACLGDMNGDGVKDGLDVQAFADCLIGGGSCPCADVDAMNGVTLDDVTAFVNGLLAGNDCP